MEVPIKNLIKTINLDEISKSNKNLNKLKKIKKYSSPIVSKNTDGSFKIFSGTNQIIEAKNKGQKNIKCLLFEDLNDQAKLEIEIQNSYEVPQVNSLHLGNLLVAYRKKFKTTQQELARRTGITAGTIHHYESLITTLAPELTDHLNTGKLTFKEARSIADIDDTKRQLEIAKPFIDGKLSSVYVEKIVSMAKNNQELEIEIIIDNVINGKPIEKPKSQPQLLETKETKKKEMASIESRILDLSAEIASLQMKNVAEFKRLKLISTLRILESRVKLTLSFLNSGPSVDFNAPISLSRQVPKNSIKTKK